MNMNGNHLNGKDFKAMTDQDQIHPEKRNLMVDQEVDGGVSTNYL